MIRTGSTIKVVRGKKALGYQGPARWVGDTKHGPAVGIKLDPSDESLLYVDLDKVEEVPTPATGQARPNPAHDEPQDPVILALKAEVSRLQALVAHRNAEVETLRAERDSARGRADEAEEERKEAEGKLGEAAKAVGRLQTDVARLQVLAQSLTTERDEARATPSPYVDASLLERAAKFGAEACRQTILVALKDSLLPKTAPKAEAAPGVRVLDLDDEPPAPKLPPASLEAARLVEDAKRVRAEIEARDAAPRTPEKAAPASQDRAEALPEAPAPKRAGGLAKCPKCKAFVIGNHSCKK